MIRASRHVTLALMTASAAASCATPGEPRQEGESEIIGRPPAPEDDPFVSTVLPSDAIAAPTSGTIGEAAPPPTDTPTTAPADEVAPPVAPAEPTAPAAAVVTRAEPTDEPPAPSVEDARHHCFSCVRLCAEDDPTCTRSGADVICGWGASRD